MIVDDRLRLATANAVAMWTALTRARGHAVHEHPGFVAVEGFRLSGMRVIVRTADLQADDRRRIRDFADEFRGKPFLVEDPFGRLDIGLTARQLPVMVREPAPVPGAPGVRAVRTKAELEAAAGIIVRGFPLEDHQPADAFPPAVLDQPGLTLFTLGEAGACLAMTDGVTGGAYWVTTLPEHRSRGVGRQLMHAVLRHFGDLPVTLTAARPGKPLYDSLGFVTVGDAHWAS